MQTASHLCTLWLHGQIGYMGHGRSCDADGVRHGGLAFPCAGSVCYPFSHDLITRPQRCLSRVAHHACHQHVTQMQSGERAGGRSAILPMPNGDVVALAESRGGVNMVVRGEITYCLPEGALG